MECKQVILVRADLKMSTGKTAAQAAHASHSAGERAREDWTDWYNAWMREGQKKVVLKVENKEEIIGLYQDARESELPCYIVSDAGLTELPEGTVTALGIGPGPSEVIDKITGHLGLL